MATNKRFTNVLVIKGAILNVNIFISVKNIRPPPPPQKKSTHHFWSAKNPHDKK